MLIISGCSSINKNNNFLLSDDFNLEPPENVSKKEIASDVNYFIHFLQNGYGGRKFIPQKDMNKALSELTELSNSATDLNVAELCRKIDEALLAINDAHLMARHNGKKCSSQREHVKEKINIGKNIYQSENPPWFKTDFLIRKKRVSIISISTLPKYEDEVWNGFLESVVDAKKSNGIIIDLRGNGGGDDSMGLALADYLYGQDHPSNIDFQIKSKTPETQAMLYNNYQIRILKLKAKGNLIPDYLLKKRDEAKVNYDHAVVNKIEEEKVMSTSGPSFNAKKGYNKPILILTDRDCASSCESIVEAFEGHPHAITIGTNTGGFCHFGNMGFVVLPSSKINIQMATDYWVYKDGRFVENIGYPPKIKLSDGQNAMDEAKKLMTRLLFDKIHN